MEFEQLIKSRHSALNFEQGFKMTEDDFKKILELTKLAPSPFNIQPTNYLIIQDEALKEELSRLNFNQHKIKTASAVVIVLANKLSIEVSEVEKMLNPMKMLKIITEDELNSTLKNVQRFGDTLKSSPTQLSLDLQVSSAVSATFFMLSAQNLGFDSCMLKIQDKEGVIKHFNIPHHLEPHLMLTIGKSVDKKRPRGYRKPFTEQVTFDKF